MNYNHHHTFTIIIKNQIYIQGDTYNIKIEKIKSNYSTETINLPVLIMLNNPAELVLHFIPAIL